MTLATNNLYSESTRGPIPHIQPDEGPGAVGQVAFSGVAGTPTLPIGTPLTLDPATGLYGKIAAGASAVGNDIYAIVWPAAVTLGGVNVEVLGTVMFRGEVDFNHILQLVTDGVITGTTTQQLKDICRKPSNRERGIVFKNLDKIGANAGLA